MTFPLVLYYKKVIFMGGQLIYNLVLVSGVQQSESVIHMHIFTLLDSIPT